MPLVAVLWYYLWIAPHILLAGILLVMGRRRLIRSHAWFFGYAVVEVTQFLVLFSSRYLPSTDAGPYFRTYSVCMAVSSVLRLGIILDAMGQLFRHPPTLRHSMQRLFRWLAAILLLAGLVLAAYAGGNASDRAWFLLNVLNRAALILQTGLLVALFAVTRYLGLSWRNQTFGIALGLGLYACMDLAGAAIRSQTGSTYNVLLNYLSMGAFHTSVVIWLVYLLAPERALIPVEPLVTEHRDAEAWNRELERLLHS